MTETSRPKMAEPPAIGFVFSEEIDALIDVMEEDGMSWSVQNSGPPFFRHDLAFIYHGAPGVGGIGASLRLHAHFRDDAELRVRMTDYALAAGGAYHEFSSTTPGYWRFPSTDARQADARPVYYGHPSISARFTMNKRDESVKLFQNDAVSAEQRADIFELSASEAASPPRDVRVFLLCEALRITATAARSISYFDLQDQLRAAVHKAYPGVMEEPAKVWPVIFALIQSGALHSTGWDHNQQTHAAKAGTVVRPAGMISVILDNLEMGVMQAGDPRL